MDTRTDKDRLYDALDEHVRDCSAWRQRVEVRLEALERKLGWPLYMPLVGSILVAVAIVFD